MILIFKWDTFMILLFNFLMFYIKITIINGVFPMALEWKPKTALLQSITLLLIFKWDTSINL